MPADIADVTVAQPTSAVALTVAHVHSDHLKVHAAWTDLALVDVALRGTM